MSAKGQAGRKLLFIGLLLFSVVAIAGDVVVNGRSFTCQNTCVVGTTSNGGWYVYDSGGGWVRENARPGGGSTQEQ